MTYCQLAAVYDRRRVRYPVRVEVKIDGVRCIAIKRSGAVTLYSRTGKTVQGEVRGLAEILARAPVDDVVLDCELGSVPPPEPEPTDPLERFAWWCRSEPALYCFDVLPLSAWDARATSAPLAERVQYLESSVRLVADRHVQQVEGWTAASQDELDRLYREVLAGGGEGIVIKELGAEYRWGRSVSWRKRKPGEPYATTTVHGSATVEQ